MAAPKATYQMAPATFCADLDSLPEELLNDVTLVCTADGGVLNGNKFILAVGSGYFRSEMCKIMGTGTKGDSRHHATIEVADVSTDIMRDILRYLRMGSIGLEAGSERHKEFVDAAVRFSLAGPFEVAQLELIRSEAPTPPLPLRGEGEEKECENNLALKVVGHVSDVIESVEVDFESEEMGKDDEDEETETESKKSLSAAQVRLLKEMSGSVPILDESSERKMLKMWKTLKMWKVDKDTGNSGGDDSGMASDDEVSNDGDVTPKTPKNWEARYSPYLTPRRQLRIRAKEVMGFSGRVWQCERCDFWAYYKRDIRRHQSCLTHRAVQFYAI